MPSSLCRTLFSNVILLFLIQGCCFPGSCTSFHDGDRNSLFSSPNNSTDQSPSLLLDGDPFFSIGTLTPLDTQLKLDMEAVAQNSGTAWDAGSGGGEGGRLFTGLYSGPYFDFTRTPERVRAQLGGAVTIPCAVKQVGNKVVSWVRLRDSYILGVDGSTFISDRRFRILRPETANGREEWNLHIKDVQMGDEGFYECQISTNTKMSHYVKLHVLEPIVRIQGGEDIHAEAGSKVILTCVIGNVIKKPRSVTWYLDNDRLSPNNLNILIKPLMISTPSKGLDIPTSSWQSDDRGATYQSVLSLLSVGTQHRGSFSCRPRGLPSAKAELHVVNGETLAAAMSDDHHVGVATGAASSSEGATTFNLVHDSIEEGGEERERENDSQNSIVVGDDPDKKGREEEGGGREQSSRGVGNEDVVSETSIGSVAVGPLAFLLKLVPVLVTLSSSSSPRYQHQHYFAAITADTTAILFISLASFSRYCFSF